LLPSAAPARKRKRMSRQPAAAAALAAVPSVQVAPQAELKVIHIHFGSVERPEGLLPFGFERVVERPAPRLTLGAPRDPVDGLLRELL
jgi:hypothetical protein